MATNIGLIHFLDGPWALACNKGPVFLPGGPLTPHSPQVRGPIVILSLTPAIAKLPATILEHNRHRLVTSAKKSSRLFAKKYSNMLLTKKSSFHLQM